MQQRLVANGFENYRPTGKRTVLEEAGGTDTCYDDYHCFPEMSRNAVSKRLHPIIHARTFGQICGHETKPSNQKALT